MTRVLVEEDPIRASVASRVPVGDHERRAIDAFLKYYDGLQAPLDQTSDVVHVTGSAIVVGEPGVLLLRHKRLGIWLQPGGHLDRGEAPVDAARREAQEETGLQLALVSPELFHVDVHPGGRGHTHLDLRYLVTPVAGHDSTPRPPVDESQEVEWFAPTAAVERADDEALRDLLRWIALIGIGQLSSQGLSPRAESVQQPVQRRP